VQLELLKRAGRHADALDVLERQTGQGSAASPPELEHDRVTARTRLLMHLGRADEAAPLLLSLLRTVDVDRWDWWRDWLACCAACRCEAETPRCVPALDGMVADPCPAAMSGSAAASCGAPAAAQQPCGDASCAARRQAALEECLDVATRMATGRERGPHLARLAALRALGRAEALAEGIVKYCGAYGGKPCCFDDVRGHCQWLASSTGSFAGLESLSTDDNDTDTAAGSGTDASSRGGHRATTAWLIRYALGLLRPAAGGGVDDLLAAARALAALHGRNVEPRDSASAETLAERQVGDTAALLAVRLLTDAADHLVQSERFEDLCASIRCEIDAQRLLRAVLACSEHNYDARLALIGSHARLARPHALIDTYVGLDIKSILADTVTPVALECIADTGCLDGGVTEPVQGCVAH
jgi:hypothetical protein